MKGAAPGGADDETGPRVGAARLEAREAREARRESLLDAATDLVDREGPFVSMDRIAAECGITKPIIYRHFGDRDGLRHAIAERFVDELITEVGPWMHRDAEPIELFTATVDAFLALIERRQNRYQFLTTTGPTHGHVMAGLVAEQVALILERILTDRGLPTEPSRPWAYGMVGMVLFTAEWWLGASATTAPPRAAVVQQLTSMIWQGFDRLGLGDTPAEPLDPRTRPAPAGAPRPHRPRRNPR